MRNPLRLDRAPGVTRRWLLGSAAAGSVGAAATVVNGSLLPETGVVAAEVPAAARRKVVIALEARGISATFFEVSGLFSEIAVVEVRDGTDPNVIRKLPGVHKVGDVTLKRGVTGNAALWAWHEAVLNGDIVAARKTCAVIVRTPRGAEVARYHLENAWPSKYEGPRPDAQGNAVAVESITIVHEGFQRVSTD